MKPQDPQGGLRTPRQLSKMRPRILSRCFRFSCGSASPALGSWCPACGGRNPLLAGSQGSPVRLSSPGTARPADEFLMKRSQRGEFSMCRHFRRLQSYQERLPRDRSGCARWVWQAEVHLVHLVHLAHLAHLAHLVHLVWQAEVAKQDRQCSWKARPSSSRTRSFFQRLSIRLEKDVFMFCPF